MSEKPINGAGDAEREPAAGEEEEILVEVEPEDEAEAEADAAKAGDVAEAGEVEAAEGLDAADWAEMVGHLEQEKTALEQRVDALEQDKKDNYERMLRAVADADNARKRARKDVDEARLDARSRTLREILPVIDNLERAVQHADQNAGDASSVIDGIKLVLRQFEQALERCDVTSVDASGKPFDPNVHEAISQQETDEVAPGTVVDVLQQGYKIGERLLRPALVVVARAAQPAPTPAPPADDDEDEPEAGDPDEPKAGETEQPEAGEPDEADEPEAGAAAGDGNGETPTRAKNGSGESEPDPDATDEESGKEA